MVSAVAGRLGQGQEDFTTTSSTTTGFCPRGQHRMNSGLSSLSDPGLNLFPTVPLGQETTTPEVPDEVPPQIKNAQLRADIRAMGRILGQVIQQYEGQGKDDDPFICCSECWYLFNIRDLKCVAFDRFPVQIFLRRWRKCGPWPR
jgi:hypothetical protein